MKIFYSFLQLLLLFQKVLVLYDGLRLREESIETKYIAKKYD